jgi:hypothetical protein
MLQHPETAVTLAVKACGLCRPDRITQKLEVEPARHQGVLSRQAREAVADHGR